MKLFAQKLCLLMLLCIQCAAPFVHAHAFGLDNHTHHVLHLHEISAPISFNFVGDTAIVKSNAIDTEGAIISIATGMKPKQDSNEAPNAQLWILVLGFILLILTPLIIRFRSALTLVLPHQPRFSLFHAQAPPSLY